MRYEFSIYIIILILSCAGCKSQSAQSNKGICQEIIAGKPIVFNGTTFDESINFLNCNPIKLTDEKSHTSVNSPLVFKDCRFNDSFIMHSGSGKEIHTCSFNEKVLFINCIFEKNVDFRSSVFNETVDFQNCQFMSDVTFEESVFNGKASFIACYFKAESRFHNTFWTDKISFMDSKFYKIISFQGSFFNNEAQFSNSEFQKYADFSNVSFNSGIFFNYATFSAKCDFSRSQFKGRCDINNAHIGTGDFSNCYFYGITRFNNLLINDNLDLSNCFFLIKPLFEKTFTNKINQTNAKVVGTTNLELKGDE